MPAEPAARRRVPRVAALLVVWALAVPLAAALGVLALRSAGTDTTVISAAQAAAIAADSPAASPSPSPAASPSSTPAPGPSPDTSPVVERRVPGAVLGLSCEQAVPTLVWSVPDPGWRVGETELEDAGLRIRLEAGDDDEVRVTVVCRDGQPEVVEAVRRED